MCGIVGFLGQEAAAPVLLDCLYNLEYRGYESAGMATLYQCFLWLKKDIGRVAQVQDKHHLDRLPGQIGIGHVRWATHGAVTPANAHPHLDCWGQVAVVHNGIIDNYQELRRRLESSGHYFRSETDSEVVCHLVEEYLDAGLSLEEALRKTTLELQGSYALVAISSREPRKMVGACYQSPLVVGLAQEGVFLASDILSFSGRCRRAITLEDGEMVVATEGGLQFFNDKGEAVAKEPQALDLAWAVPSRNSQEYFMLKEILEGPQALRQALNQDGAQLQALAQAIHQAPQVVITACGSSYHAGLLGKYLFSRLGGKFGQVVPASELPHLASSLGRDSLVIAVSQSGETADVMEGVRQVRAQGARVASIVNAPASLLARASDHILYLNCGPEVGVAASKTFLCQVGLFYLLAQALAGRLEEGTDKLREASFQIEESLEANGEGIKELAWQMRGEKDCYFIARGPNFPLALEGALKLKEICYIHAEGMAGGELKHGTLALIEAGTPVVALCPRDDTFREMLGNIMEVSARGARVIGVSDESAPSFHHWIPLPRMGELLYPLALAPPLHLLAYHLSLAQGLDPDHPRNLAKAVTVK